MKLRSLISVTFDQGGQPAGRIFLINLRDPRKQFQKADLAWLERIARHVGPALENIFLLRHLRARAIEGERSRISRRPARRDSADAAQYRDSTGRAAPQSD